MRSAESGEPDRQRLFVKLQRLGEIALPGADRTDAGAGEGRFRILRIVSFMERQRLPAEPQRGIVFAEISQHDRRGDRDGSTEPPRSELRDLRQFRPDRFQQLQIPVFFLRRSGGNEHGPHEVERPLGDLGLHSGFPLAPFGLHFPGSGLFHLSKSEKDVLPRLEFTFPRQLGAQLRPGLFPAGLFRTLQCPGFSRGGLPLLPSGGPADLERPDRQSGENESDDDADVGADPHQPELLPLDRRGDLLAVQIEHVPQNLDETVFPALPAGFALIGDHGRQIPGGHGLVPEQSRQTLVFTAASGAALQDHGDDLRIIVVVRGEKILDLLADPQGPHGGGRTYHQQITGRGQRLEDLFAGGVLGTFPAAEVAENGTGVTGIFGQVLRFDELHRDAEILDMAPQEHRGPAAVLPRMTYVNVIFVPFHDRSPEGPRGGGPPPCAFRSASFPTLRGTAAQNRDDLFPRRSRISHNVHLQTEIFKLERLSANDFPRLFHSPSLEKN